jgi:murein DD-endopeptidase MepM/ murein hydrolase activator NlpD
MLKKRISVLIVPYPKGKALRLSIPLGVILLPAFFLFLFVISDVFFSVNYIKKIYDTQKIAELSKQNAHMESKFFDAQALAHQLKTDILLILEHEKKVERFLGLAERGRALRSAELPDLKLQPQPLRAEADLDLLLATTLQQREALNQIYDKFVVRRDRLDHTPSILPVPGRLTRGFGLHSDPFTGQSEHHAGVDLAAPWGTPVQASATGRIVYAGWRSGLGKAIIINHGRGFETYYGHLSAIRVTPGQRVTKGQLIGAVGSTGYSTGPHLHYEVHLRTMAQNPMRYVLIER